MELALAVQLHQLFAVVLSFLAMAVKDRELVVLLAVHLELVVGLQRSFRLAVISFSFSRELHS